ncbi:unnamed protein product, partial [Urochloa humidicola]
GPQASPPASSLARFLRRRTLPRRQPASPRALSKLQAEEPSEAGSLAASCAGAGEYSSMEPEVVKAEMVLAPTLPFKKVQTADKYPKGQSRGRQWKHLRHLLQAADASSMPPDRPNYLNIQSPPSIYPPKRYCDITGFEAPYVDPRTKLRYADPEVFKQIRMLPDEYVQRYLALRNAAVVLR